MKRHVVTLSGRVIKLETVLDCLTSGPAKTLNLDASIEEGMKADLCAFDLNKEYTIKEEDLKSKACNTPFLGWKVKGELIMNIVDLNKKYDGKQVVNSVTFDIPKGHSAANLRSFRISFNRSRQRPVISPHKDLAS